MNLRINYTGLWQIYARQACQCVQIDEHCTLATLLSDLYAGLETQDKQLVRHTFAFGKAKHSTELVPLANGQKLHGLSEVVLVGPVSGG